MPDLYKGKKNELVLALVELRNMRPWSGTIVQQKEKYVWIFRKMCSIYNLTGYKIAFNLPKSRLNFHSSGSSHYVPRRKTIVLEGRLSIITFLHEFGHIFYRDENKAQQFAIGLFKEIFYEKFISLTGSMNGRFFVNRRSHNV